MTYSAFTGEKGPSSCITPEPSRITPEPSRITPAVSINPKSHILNWPCCKPGFLVTFALKYNTFVFFLVTNNYFIF